jgi:hypothetical protein
VPPEPPDPDEPPGTAVTVAAIFGVIVGGIVGVEVGRGVNVNKGVGVGRGVLEGARVEVGCGVLVGGKGVNVGVNDTASFVICAKTVWAASVEISSISAGTAGLKTLKLQALKSSSARIEVKSHGIFCKFIDSPLRCLQAGPCTLAIQQNVVLGNFLIRYNVFRPNLLCIRIRLEKKQIFLDLVVIDRIEQKFYNKKGSGPVFYKELEMSARTLLFSGNTQVHLEGQEALTMMKTKSTDQLIYSVGSPKSSIQVHDFRRDVSEAARNALAGKDVEQFMHLFNQPAWIAVHLSSESTDIEMHKLWSKDSITFREFPTLWLGVIEENRALQDPLEWEILEPVGKSRIAYAALGR